MARHVVQTDFGEVWVFGERTGRPVLFCVTGAFADFTQTVFHLQPYFPGFDVLAAHLPGNHCPQLASASIGVWAAAYDQALAQVADGSPVSILGESTGALVALAMRSPAERIILIEPPLVSEKLWPLLPFFQERAAEHPWLFDVFGVGPDRVEPRDYRHLVDQISVPTLAVWGEVPLGCPRDVEPSPPSLVDEPERDLFRANPMVKTSVVVGAGHNVFRANVGGTVEALAAFLSPSASCSDSDRLKCSLPPSRT